jgi:hypothetical protein
MIVNHELQTCGKQVELGALTLISSASIVITLIDLWRTRYWTFLHHHPCHRPYPEGSLEMAARILNYGAARKQISDFYSTDEDIYCRSEDLTLLEPQDRLFPWKDILDILKAKPTESESTSLTVAERLIISHTISWFCSVSTFATALMLMRYI